MTNPYSSFEITTCTQASIQGAEFCVIQKLAGSPIHLNRSWFLCSQAEEATET